MKPIICLFILFVSCSVISEKKVLPPELYITADDTMLHNNNGTWIWKKEKLNGYIIEKARGVLQGKVPIINGKENGIAYAWYTNGKKKFEYNFLNGNREGTQKGWYPNDSLSFVYFFHNDKYEGEQLTYYENGRIWHSLHYENGYELGRQKSWSDSGKVINNFTVKNGKLYGVIGRFDCMSVYKK